LLLCVVSKIKVNAPRNRNDHHLLLKRLKSEDNLPPTILKWDTITASKSFSILTIALDHNSDGPWFIPSQHDKDSIGWNRTVYKQIFLRPNACNVRFFGIGLETELANFVWGGSGYIALQFTNEDHRTFWHGFNSNETWKTYCYYTTTKNYGSEFMVSQMLVSQLNEYK
jgi:hypothetical protein